VRLSSTSVVRLKSRLRHKSFNLLLNENGKTNWQCRLCQECIALKNENRQSFPARGPIKRRRRVNRVPSPSFIRREVSFRSREQCLVPGIIQSQIPVRSVLQRYFLSVGQQVLPSTLPMACFMCRVCLIRLGLYVSLRPSQQAIPLTY
jgi:hypothetical protein